MKLSHLLLFVSFLALVSCSSSVAPLKYYVLHAPNTQNQVILSETAHRVQLKQIILPDYLKQRALVVQTSSTTLHFSTGHVWAEPLNKSLRQALSAALWQEGRIMVVPDNVYTNEYPLVGLHIQVDDFLSTDGGKVLIKGQYWLDNVKNPQVQYFDYRQTLQEDGFEHAVEKMRALVSDLAKAISSYLSAE
ncbi:membrane integrity-associated transporter subunit PqiC [Aestuariibacter sp. A3R04]|uniref:PqiC family protein n=1 Tax=Aestuariibacter sp. A3R04 TaxID=2841571 RepID=UPI001C09A047|nr:PqiC family protein [Aestuariibacter sp. A3R04]MBU3022465.1 PqiC family protein [Aestuariibacter sp. A3R04]